MLKPDPIDHIEGQHYILDTHTWLRTSVAASLLGISHGTLNRDCKAAIEEDKGNLSNLKEYILRDDNGEWWVRADLDEKYTMRAPGRAGQGQNPSWFLVKDLQTGERPT